MRQRRRAPASGRAAHPGALVAFDAQTEDVERTTVLEATQGASIVWITHQLAGLDAFGEVIAVEDGRRSPAPELRGMAGTLWAGRQ
jgi:ABC-type multidrug transport system fused ATPase/permease subunit